MLAATFTLVRAFWNVCTFRSGPRDIPRSQVLFALTSLVNVVMSIFINELQFGFAIALMAGLVEFGVLVGVTTLLLYYFSHLPRLLQTLTALMGSGAVIGAIVLVILFVFPHLPLFFQLAILLWNLLVMSHILRQALSVHGVAAFLMALGYAVVLNQILVFILNSSAGPVQS